MCGYHNRSGQLIHANVWQYLLLIMAIMAGHPVETTPSLQRKQGWGQQHEFKSCRPDSFPSQIAQSGE
jgi:hypothetical protein